MLAGETVFINGDGETSRDFCFVANAVQANLLAATSDRIEGHEVFNVAVGDRTSLNGLFDAIRSSLEALQVRVASEKAYRDFRAGDVRHSQADVGKARELLGYEPTHRLREGLAEAMPWYRSHLIGVSELRTGTEALGA